MKIYFLILYLFLLIVTNMSNGKPCYSDQPSNTYQKIILSQQPASHISVWILNVLTILTVILFLILLGLVKGIIGLLCCAPLGMWGLGTLIDLPQPLQHYQEGKLRDTPVVYDHVGWPVHPDTGKRCVRAVPKKTEFYLNTIFFLTYPLVIMVTLCSWCCFQETSQEDNKNFKCINTITFDHAKPRQYNAEEMTKARSTSVSKTQKTTKETKAVYSNDDSEENDTNYVLYQMRRSEESLQKGVIK